MKQQEQARIEKFVVRFPAGMRDHIAAASHLGHRSMNAEIVARLQHSLGHWPESLPVARHAAPAGDEECYLLGRFRGLPPAKRQALLALLD